MRKWLVALFFANKFFLSFLPARPPRPPVSLLLKLLQCPILVEFWAFISSLEEAFLDLGAFSSLKCDEIAEKNSRKPTRNLVLSYFVLLVLSPSFLVSFLSFSLSRLLHPRPGTFVNHGDPAETPQDHKSRLLLASGKNY